MNHDKIDELLMKSGVRFEFLHGKDYEDFCPYKFTELLVRELAESFQAQHTWVSNIAAQRLILRHFGVE